MTKELNLKKTEKLSFKLFLSNEKYKQLHKVISFFSPYSSGVNTSIFNTYKNNIRCIDPEIYKLFAARKNKEEAIQNKFALSLSKYIDSAKEKFIDSRARFNITSKLYESLEIRDDASSIEIFDEIYKFKKIKEKLLEIIKDNFELNASSSFNLQKLMVTLGNDSRQTVDKDQLKFVLSTLIKRDRINQEQKSHIIRLFKDEWSLADLDGKDKEEVGKLNWPKNCSSLDFYHSLKDLCQKEEGEWCYNPFEWKKRVSFYCDNDSLEGIYNEYSVGIHSCNKLYEKELYLSNRANFFAQQQKLAHDVLFKLLKYQIIEASYFYLFDKPTAKFYSTDQAKNKAHGRVCSFLSAVRDASSYQDLCEKIYALLDEAQKDGYTIGRNSFFTYLMLNFYDNDRGVISVATHLQEYLADGKFNVANNLIESLDKLKFNRARESEEQLKLLSSENPIEILQKVQPALKNVVEQKNTPRSTRLFCDNRSKIKRSAFENTMGVKNYLLDLSFINRAYRGAFLFRYIPIFGKLIKKILNNKSPVEKRLMIGTCSFFTNFANDASAFEYIGSTSIEDDHEGYDSDTSSCCSEVSDF